MEYPREMLKKSNKKLKMEKRNEKKKVGRIRIATEEDYKNGPKRIQFIGSPYRRRPAAEKEVEFGDDWLEQDSMKDILDSMKLTPEEKAEVENMIQGSVDSLNKSVESRQ